jgi:hypothetical protein
MYCILKATLRQSIDSALNQADSMCRLVANLGESQS